VTLDQLCWLATAAYAIHVLEEYMLNWRDWARGALKLQVDWVTFYVTNAGVIVLGIVAAEIAPQLPSLALCFPALMLVNATFFHVLPTLAMHGRFSPGLLTAILLFYPIGVFSYLTAYRAGVLTLNCLVISGAGGVLLMATPIVLLKIRGLSYFLQRGE
jgi:hypothetical protein